MKHGQNEFLWKISNEKGMILTKFDKAVYRKNEDVVIGSAEPFTGHGSLSHVSEAVWRNGRPSALYSTLFWVNCPARE
jgi:hypothetical protein